MNINGKQNPEKSFTNKYQKHVTGSYSYVMMISLVNLLKSYLCEDAVYNFINSMIKESKYFTDIMKKHFNK